MSQLQCNPNIVYRQIGTETVLVPVGQDVDSVRSVYTLNESAAFVFKKLREGLSLDQILNEIENEFTVSNAEATRMWVDELIAEFRQNKIIL